MKTNGALNHSCAMCAKAFRARSRLFRHILAQHTLERPYRCSHCKSDFSDKDYLRDHIRRKHKWERTTREGRTSAEGPTDECPQQEHDVDGYLSEISCRDVSNFEAFKCTEEGCSYTALGKRDRNRHMAVHSPERPFGCSKCSSRFKRNDQLRSHLWQVHSPERPFGCSECSSRFKASSPLRRHIRDVHSSERPFGCSKCSSRFKRKDHLRHHLILVHRIEDVDFFLHLSDLLSC